MSITTVYVYNSVRFDSEELAQQAAQQLDASIHNLPCSFCTVTVVIQDFLISQITLAD